MELRERGDEVRSENHGICAVVDDVLIRVMVQKVDLLLFPLQVRLDILR